LQAEDVFYPAGVIEKYLKRRAEFPLYRVIIPMYKKQEE